MEDFKTYFILRTTEYRPNDLIQLGQLIPNPRIPYRRLAPPIQPVPAGQVSSKTEWSLEKGRAGNAKVGVFARFLSAVDAEASARASREQLSTWAAATLETHSFELGPDGRSDYVTSSVKAEAVQSWLRENKGLGKTVYMVTGVKVAMKPGEITHGISKSAGFDARFSIDPGTGGVAQTGAEASLETSGSTKEKSKPSEDFVFAYRLRKVYVSWLNKVTLEGDVLGGDLQNFQGDGEWDVSDYSDSSEDDTKNQQKSLNSTRGTAEESIKDILLEHGDFGSALPATDVKLESVDEDDGVSCLVVLVHEPMETG